MAALPTAFLLETSIQIQPANTPIYETEGLIEVLGYKDPTTTATDGPYGGLSKNMIRTGGTPSELKIFLLDCVTGARPDSIEGVRLVLVDAAGDRQTPFEKIYLKAGTTAGSPEYILTVDVDQYTCADGTSNVQIEKYFRQNINNTPAIELRAYLADPVAP